MPIAIIAGLPRLTVVKHHKGYVYEAPCGWSFVWNHAEAWQPDLGACWKSLIKKIEEIEASLSKEWLHILVFHKNDQTRRKFIERIEPYHRIRFLDHKMVGKYGLPEFTGYLNNIFSEESLWCDHIRPNHHNHPLILPENFFTPIKNHKKIWSEARTANSSRDINNVADMLVGFRRIHKEMALGLDCYEDDAGLRFKYNVEPHGRAALPQENWKFSFRLPNAMQYDVESKTGKKSFKLRGLFFKSHANISPHGSIIAGPRSL